LIIYVCFSVSAIESIVVYNLFHWKTFCAEREARKLSWAKYKKRLNEWRHYNTFRERDVERDARREEYGGDSFVDAVDAVDVADEATDGCADGAYEINEVNGSTSAPRRNIGFGLRRLRKGEKTSQEGGMKDRALSRCDSPGKPTVASILREDGNYGKALAVGNPLDPRALARHDSHSRYTRSPVVCGQVDLCARGNLLRRCHPGHLRHAERLRSPVFDRLAGEFGAGLKSVTA